MKVDYNMYTLYSMYIIIIVLAIAGAWLNILTKDIATYTFVAIAGHFMGVNTPSPLQKSEPLTVETPDTIVTTREDIKA